MASLASSAASSRRRRPFSWSPGPRTAAPLTRTPRRASALWPTEVCSLSASAPNTRAATSVGRTICTAVRSPPRTWRSLSEVMFAFSLSHWALYYLALFFFLKICLLFGECAQFFTVFALLLLFAVELSECTVCSVCTVSSLVQEKLERSKNLIDWLLWP